MSKILDLLYSARLRFDAAAGNLERAGADLARRIDWQDWRPGRRTVLCLRRSTFVKDVDQMHLRGTFNWAKVSAARVRKFQERWVPPEYRIQTYFYNFLETSLLPDARRAHERDLVAAYHAALVAIGVADHPLEECWDDVRYGAHQGPLVTVLGAAFSQRTDRGDDMFVAMASRSCDAIRDLGTLALI